MPRGVKVDEPAQRQTGWATNFQIGRSLSPSKYVDRMSNLNCSITSMSSILLKEQLDKKNVVVSPYDSLNIKMKKSGSSSPTTASISTSRKASPANSRVLDGSVSVSAVRRRVHTAPAKMRLSTPTNRSGNNNSQTYENQRGRLQTAPPQLVTEVSQDLETNDGYETISCSPLGTPVNSGAVARAWTPNITYIEDEETPIIYSIDKTSGKPKFPPNIMVDTSMVEHSPNSPCASTTSISQPANPNNQGNSNSATPTNQKTSSSAFRLVNSGSNKTKPTKQLPNINEKPAEQVFHSFKKPIFPSTSCQIAAEKLVMQERRIYKQEQYRRAMSPTSTPVSALTTTGHTPACSGAGTRRGSAVRLQPSTSTSSPTFRPLSSPAHRIRDSRSLDSSQLNQSSTISQPSLYQPSLNEASLMTDASFDTRSRTQTRTRTRRSSAGGKQSLIDSQTSRDSVALPVNPNRVEQSLIPFTLFLDPAADRNGTGSPSAPKSPSRSRSPSPSISRGPGVLAGGSVASSKSPFSVVAMLDEIIDDGEQAQKSVSWNKINCKHRAACVAIIRGRTLIGGKKEWIERPLEKCEKRLFGSPYGANMQRTSLERSKKNNKKKPIC